MSPKPNRPAKALVPGVVLALAITGIAMWLAQKIGTDLLRASGPSPVSHITVAILLGALVGNLFGVSDSLRPGLDFCVSKLLRAGIVMIGLKLSLGDVLHLGAFGVPVVLLFISLGLASTICISRWVGISDGLGLLTAAATAICGITAAVSVAPVVEASDEELSYAVANVTVFGVLGMLMYPYLAHTVFDGHSLGAGLFLGTSIHDTSQVMGAAISYRSMFQDETAFKVATVTKLTRNVFLVAVVPLLAWLHARKHGTEKRATDLRSLFPTFVLAFLLMVIVRTFGDAQWPREHAWHSGWTTTHKTLSDSLAPVALGAALASVGLTTRIAQLRSLGISPLLVGGSAALLVGSLGMALALAAARLAS